jgi:hypothetical protein
LSGLGRPLPQAWLAMALLASSPLTALPPLTAATAPPALTAAAPDGDARDWTGVALVPAEADGTALCLRVAPDGTTLFAVLEGAVTITSRGGGQVRVPQGSWTELAPNRPPRPPSRLDSRIGTLSPQAGGPAFTMPGETLIAAPPNIDLKQLASDLPKARHP